MITDPIPSPEDNTPSLESIKKTIEYEMLKMGLLSPKADFKISGDMLEEMIVFGVVGGFLHNLDYIDDPLFIEAANGTIEAQRVPLLPIPEEDKVQSKVPMTLSGYGLLDKEGNLIGFSCFESQLGGYEEPK